MIVKPWANAIAAIPGRPTPSPTTAAAPAPMNTNAKVPMNSASSLGAREFDIADLQRWSGSARRDVVCARKQRVGLGVAGGAGERLPPAGERRERALFRGDHLRL